MPGSTFRCWLDGVLEESCTSPEIYTEPGRTASTTSPSWPGSQRYLAGPVDGVGVAHRRHDGAARLIDSGPDIESQSVRGEFVWHSNEDGVTFRAPSTAAIRCRASRRSTSRGSSPASTRWRSSPSIRLSRGLDGEILDPLYEEVPAIYDWIVVDLAPPETAIRYGPPAVTTSMSAYFGFATNDPTATDRMLARLGGLRRLRVADRVRGPARRRAHPPGPRRRRVSERRPDAGDLALDGRARRGQHADRAKHHRRAADAAAAGRPPSTSSRSASPARPRSTRCRAVRSTESCPATAAPSTSTSTRPRPSASPSTCACRTTRPTSSTAPRASSTSAAASGRTSRSRTTRTPGLVCAEPSDFSIFALAHGLADGPDRPHHLRPRPPQRDQQRDLHVRLRRARDDDHLLARRPALDAVRVADDLPPARGRQPQVRGRGDRSVHDRQPRACRRSTSGRSPCRSTRRRRTRGSSWARRRITGQPDHRARVHGHRRPDPRASTSSSSASSTAC